MATNNAINANSAGLVRYNGAGTFDAVSTTNHDILIGATSNGITNVAPSATSGVALISQGAAADPAFGTVVVAGGGTGAITLTGVLIGNGISAVTGNAITQHDVLVGGASNAITSVAPSATSGIPLISQGASSDPLFGTAVVVGGGTGAITLTNHAVLLGQATAAVAFAGPGATSGVPLIAQGISADPIFGTALVAGGGTGATSFTAYTPVCGGTTTTGTLQSVASLGTSGQILTSNGAGALPTFQANSGIFAPNSTVTISDDFILVAITSPSGTVLASSQTWTLPLGAFSQALTSAISTNPGILNSQSFSSGTISLFGTTGQIVLGGGAISLNWVIKLATLSDSTNRYTFVCGLVSVAGSPVQNGIYFSYSDNVNSGNWQGICTASGVSSTANSAVAAVNNAYVNLGITVNAAATSVRFFVNGVEIANSPLSTNIPSVAISPYLGITRSAGTIGASSVLVDLFYLTQSLTTPR